ncbi:unnamed protein product, partial [Brenthis ino]
MDNTKNDNNSLLRKFCLESSILGLKYFYIYPDTISRCFWAVALVLVLLSACLLTWMLHSRFLEMPTRITIENQYEVMKNLSFPAVTICSPNQVTISAMTHFNRTLVNEKNYNFKPFKTSNIGVVASLTVVADYNPDDALHGTILTAGAIRVMFTDWTEFPADDQTSLVQPYTESFHIIHPTYTYCSEEVTTMPSWSRKCYFEDEYSQPHFGYYHNSDCDLLCEVHELERLCQCTMVYIPYVKMSHACNVSSINCIVDAKMQMNKWYRTEQCDCPRDCVSFQYQVEMSAGNLDALPYMIHNPYKNIELNKTTSIMHFFIPSSVYTKRKQETIMSLISLSSNLGGVFGLCLGCSVISVVEIFFFLYLTIKHKIRENINKIWNNRVNYMR